MTITEKPANAATTFQPRAIKKIAILGSGIMGSRIACHFANIGVEVLLLDIVPRELDAKEAAAGLSLAHPAVRNRIVNTALQNTLKDKNSPVYTQQAAKLVKTGNFDDDMSKIAQCDWILEAVVERLDIKQQIFEKVEQHRKAGTIVSTNTSGIPLYMIAEGRSEDFRRHFVGTHFFNPPRYLRLLEIIPGPATDPGLLDFMMHYGDLYLGKQTVLCKDTPAFIANRVGIFAMAKIYRLVEEMGLTIEEVDALTGPATGKPKTGTFRLSDLVGLDTTAHVLNGIRHNCPQDEQRNLFEIPGYVQTLLERKWLGDKTEQGFYKKVKDESGESKILSLDLKTLEYRDQARAKIGSLEASKNMDGLKERVLHLFNAQDRGGEFTRKSSLGLWSYVSNRIPEIADHLYQIDDAICAGFAWEKGPFELWDMVGVEKTLDLFAAEGLTLSPWIQDMIDAGCTQFYTVKNGVKHYYDIASTSYKAMPGADSFIILETRKESHTVWSNDSVSLIDLGDNVYNIAFHSKMNSLGEGVIRGIHHAIDLAEKNRYAGLVIANEGSLFSAGANLALISMLAYDQEWDDLNLAVHTFQQTSMRLRTSSIPVVIAPHNMTLGGGCEFTMHADAVVAAAELYIGLVEVGVGLIPGGGGTKEYALRASQLYDQEGFSGVAILQKYLMNIAMAKVATSAFEAKELDILRKSDKIVVNQARRVKEAKDTVLEMAAAGYTPPLPRTDIRVLGRSALGTFYAGIAGLQFGHYASAYDAHLARKTAYVLCGGDLSGDDNRVSEQYLLDLEREVFLSLLGEQKTLQRIEHMLKTGKPLRN